MSTSIAIEAIDLGKCYQRRGVGSPTLLSKLGGIFRPQKVEEFWALRHVSFKVPRGQTVGIIGPNGSGKSSTLGLVAGTITPTEGRVLTRGRISSLLELGAGFHPDLTGVENIYLNAAVLGIPREDIRKRIDHIVEFANLRDFIDMPVKHYSSGMYVRLGFAVAIETDPDILLVDEVLAVGDLAFHMKCLERIREMQKKGKTLLFVTHDLQTVEQFCDDVKLVHRGELVMQGDPSDVILEYMKRYMMRIGSVAMEEFGTREVEMSDVKLRDEAGKETARFTTGKTMQVEIRYNAKKRIENPVFGFSVKTGTGFYIFGTNTQIMNVSIPYVEGQGTITLTVEPLRLMEGKYFLSLAIHDQTHAIQYHRREDWHPFAVANPDTSHGVVHLDCRWQHRAG